MWTWSDDSQVGILYGLRFDGCELESLQWSRWRISFRWRKKLNKTHSFLVGIFLMPTWLAPTLKLRICHQILIGVLRSSSFTRLSVYIILDPIVTDHQVRLLAITINLQSINIKKEHSDINELVSSTYNG